MSSNKVVALAFAAASLLAMPVAFADSPAQVITNGPQTDPGDHSPRWSAARNNAESAQYDRLLQMNPRFRMARMRKECGPINDRQLRSSCMASFSGQTEMMSGSSVPPAPISNSSGGNY